MARSSGFRRSAWAAGVAAALLLLAACGTTDASGASTASGSSGSSGDSSVIKAAKIPMFSAYGTTDPEGTTNWIFANPGGPEGYVVKGNVLANWVTADSNGKANTLLVNVPSISVFALWEQEFRKAYAKSCPGCS